MRFRLLRGGVFPYGNNQESQHATDSDQETTDDEFHVRLLSVLNRYFRLPQECNNPYTPLEVATAVPYVPEKKVFADSPKPFEKFCIGRAI